MDTGDEGSGEWVVGRLRAPIYITHDGVPIRPDVVFCLDTGSRVIVGSEVTFPGDPPGVVLDCLNRAMEKPLAGPPRRPATVRVQDEELADLLRRALEGVQVRLDQAPELDDALRVFAHGFHRSEPAPSYLDGERIAVTGVEAFFTAAAELYRVAPWNDVPDHLLFCANIPALGLHGVCVSVIGALGESLGLLVFESLDDYHRFAAAGEDPTLGAGDLGAHVFALNFEQGSEIPRSLRREIATHGWPVAGPRAYPNIMRIDPDHICRPLTNADYELAVAVAVGVARFVDRHRPLFSEAEPKPVGEVFRYGPDAEQVVDVVVPHPDSTLVFRDAEDGEPEDFSLFAEAHAADLESQAIIGAFLDALELEGRSEQWRDVAEFVCEQLFTWKLDDMDGALDRWTAAQVQYFMLEVFPESVGGDAAALEAVPDILLALFGFLGEEGRITPRRADAVVNRVNKIRSRFLKLVRQPAPSASPLVQLSRPRRDKDRADDN